MSDIRPFFSIVMSVYNRAAVVTKSRFDAA